MIEKTEKEKVMVDSCVFLRILLDEAGTDKCQEELERIKEENKQMCVTLGIIYEIIKGLEEDIEKEVNTLNPIINQKREKIRRERLFDHLGTLRKLTQEGSILFLEDGKNPKETWEKCMTHLRIGGKNRGGWDRLHLAIAISNSCSEFITVDGSIKNEERNISSLSNNLLKVILIK